MYDDPTYRSAETRITSVFGAEKPKSSNHIYGGWRMKWRGWCRRYGLSGNDGFWFGGLGEGRFICRAIFVTLLE
jgi:hypothetical protein